MTVDVEQTNLTDSRQWLAMRNVLGELTAEQAAEFETAMTNDVSLCEAVSEAVQLFSGVVLACEADRIAADAVSVAPRHQRQSRIAVFAACSALALILVVMFFTQPSGNPTVVADNSASEADVLASLLSDELPPEISSDSEVDLMLEDSLADLVAPEWLLTAIELDDALKEPGEFPGQTPDDETDVF